MRKSLRGGTASLPKTPTGISGFDEITGGGLPAGRPTLICGSAGCGKTMLAMNFIVRGIEQYGEPGVFVTFEERSDDLVANVSSLGFDLPAMTRAKKLVVEHIEIERSQIEETGAYDLEGLFIRIGAAIDAVGAKRVVLDTIEALFAGLSDHGMIRSELRRLFTWLKQRGVTALVTAERGEGTLTRHGIEEYVSDCVIVLDHRVTSQISTRRLRIVKYRGSAHGTNEYPFLIDVDGINVLPITTTALKHEVSSERISSGIPRLDAMLGGGGYYRGSSILVSGNAGTGKTSIASHFANASAASGKRCLFFAFEESPAQIIRNMRSIGIDLEQWVRKGLLQIRSSRPTAFGLEMHLVEVHRELEKFKPDVTVFDPISNMLSVGTHDEVREMLMRLIDGLKCSGTTSIFTTLSHVDASASLSSQVGVSSLMDTWLLLQDAELNGERNRTLYILKSRGMAHSNQVREFILTNHGIDLEDVYVGNGVVLTGSARIAQQAREREESAGRREDVERHRAALEMKKLELKAEIADLQRQLEIEEALFDTVLRESSDAERREQTNRETMAIHRNADRMEIRRRPASRSTR